MSPLWDLVEDRVTLKSGRRYRQLGTGRDAVRRYVDQKGQFTYEDSSGKVMPEIEVEVELGFLVLPESNTLGGSTNDREQGKEFTIAIRERRSDSGVGLAPGIEAEDQVGPLHRTYQRSIVPSSIRSVRPDQRSAFQVRHRRFYHPGRIFEVLWSEPRGATEGTSSGSEVWHRKKRPMVVVRQLYAHCLCVPIYSYGGKGALKSNLHRSEVRYHAVIYDVKMGAKYVDEEIRLGMSQHTFAARMFGNRTLDKSSRVRFDCLNTVQYNLEVSDMGKVNNVDQFVKQLEPWFAATSVSTQQS